MKHILFIFFLMCSMIFNECHAQYQKWSADYTPLSKYETVDIARLKLTYTFSHIYDPDLCNLRYRDVHTLLIGDHYSNYFSQQFVDFCVKKEAKQASEALPPQGTIGLNLYKNYPYQGKMTVVELGGEISFGANLMYEEEMPAIHWQLHNDTTTILFYSCKKATADFRGRHYVAWYAPEIPISDGPWKLGGLPGMILQAGDSENDIVFECIGIEKFTSQEVTRLYDGLGGGKPKKELADKDLIKFYDVKYKKLTRDEFMKTMQLFTSDPSQYWLDNGLERGVGYKLLPLPFNSMERNFDE